MADDIKPKDVSEAAATVATAISQAIRESANVGRASWLEQARGWAEPVIAIVALIFAFKSCGVSDAALQTQIADSRRQAEVTHQESAARYLETIYERSSCEKTSTVNAACGLDDEDRPTCKLQCLPVHQLRLRVAAAQGLLSMSGLPSIREDKTLSLYGYDLVLANARLPRFAPSGDFRKIQFDAADLRCSDWAHATFASVSFDHADLRGATNLGTLKVDSWDGALCPDGKAWVARGATCADHMMPADPQGLCAVEARSVPHRNADGTLGPDVPPEADEAYRLAFMDRLDHSMEEIFELSGCERSTQGACTLTAPVEAYRACTANLIADTKDSRPILRAQSGARYCERRCPPAHDLRLRMESAKALLAQYSQAPSNLRLLMENPSHKGGLSLAFDYAALPWISIPAGTYDSVNFHGADLRCADFTQASFRELFLNGADLRGAVLGDAAKNVKDWTRAICPDGALSTNETDGCKAHLRTAYPQASDEWCDVYVRPPPPCREGPPRD
jgi:uncharacterized protein YjbI with pentapeptide repeats